MNGKKWCLAAVTATVCWLVLAGSVLRQEKLASQMIRLHVIANSDSEQDQTVKLWVRDAVLEQVGILTSGCKDRKEAALQLKRNVETLGKTAADAAGKPVTVTLGAEEYETRAYNGFKLPAGEYLSLQIGIGEACGKNWWCVAFPMVCITATAEEFESVAAAAGLDGEDIRFMTDDSPEITVRFALLEWLQALRERLRS